MLSDYSDLYKCLQYLCRGQRIRIDSYTSQDLVFSVQMVEKSLIKKFKKNLSFKNLSGLVDKLSVQVLETGEDANGYDETTLSDVEELIVKFVCIILFWNCITFCLNSMYNILLLLKTVYLLIENFM